MDFRPSILMLDPGLWTAAASIGIAFVLLILGLHFTIGASFALLAPIAYISTLPARRAKRYKIASAFGDEGQKALDRATDEEIEWLDAMRSGVGRVISIAVIVGSIVGVFYFDLGPPACDDSLSSCDYVIR